MTRSEGVGVEGPRFAGRRVVVTGAASGIGRATAERFAAEGALVVVADIDAGGAAEAAAAIGQSATPITFDQSSDESIVTLASAVMPDGIDVLCVNAGAAGIPVPLEEVGPEEWDWIQGVNLRGAFLTVQRCLSALSARPGASVIFTSSIAATKSRAGRPSYDASKAGLLGLSRSLAVELGPRGIRVNAVCPGGTMTPLARSTSGPAFDAEVEGLKGRIPLRRVADPEDVAAVIAFLASDDARHVTGAAIPVDGGQSIVA